MYFKIMNQAIIKTNQMPSGNKTVNKNKAEQIYKHLTNISQEEENSLVFMHTQTLLNHPPLNFSICIQNFTLKRS